MEQASTDNLIRTLEGVKLFGLIMSTDGIIVHANAFTHTILGYKPSELNGKDFFSTLLPPEESEARRASFNKAIASGGLFEERAEDRDAGGV